LAVSLNPRLREKKKEKKRKGVCWKLEEAAESTAFLFSGQVMTQVWFR
jgi:hypothetical protein